MGKSASRQDPEIELVLAALANTPKEIARIARGYDAAQLRRPPSPEAWSARDIMAHLRACADVWGGSIDRMVTEDHPRFRYVSPRGWMKKSGYLDHDFHASLQAFSDARAALLGTLRSLDPDGWSRGATLTGTTRSDPTVLDYAKRMADHEVRHIDQLNRTLTR
jgi:hypothetical protein